MGIQLGRPILLGICVLAVGAQALLLILQAPESRGEARPYSTFLRDAAQGRVTHVTVSGQHVAGRLVSGESFHTTVPAGDTRYLGLLVRSGTTVRGEPSVPSGPWLVVLTAFTPLALAGALWVLLGRDPGPEAEAGPGTNTRWERREPIPTVTFDDVGGLEDAKEELGELIRFLRDPGPFLTVGARPPRGILLVGPPGCGKTLLARAIAGEARVPALYASGSEFVEIVAGVGAQRVRDLFQRAREQAPCLVVLDAIDAVGRRRQGSLDGAREEQDQTLNQLLVELDGFDASRGVAVIATTSLPQVLDPALVRPGRFDRQIVLEPPPLPDRRAILAVHLRRRPVDGRVDLDHVALRTPGLTGADLAHLVNDAALLAARRGRSSIGPEDVEDALERVTRGPGGAWRLLCRRGRELAAYHEAGHALVALLLPGASVPFRVTAASGAADPEWWPGPRERAPLTRRELRADLAVLLAGREAELLALGDVSTRGAGDLRRATELALQMVCRFGMSDALGPVALRVSGAAEATASRIDLEVRRIIEECAAQARCLLTAKRRALVRVAGALAAGKSLGRDELAALVRGRPRRRHGPPSRTSTPLRGSRGRGVARGVGSTEPKDGARGAPVAPMAPRRSESDLRLD